MNIWIEIQKNQANTKELLLNNLTGLSEDGVEAELLLKSEDFLHVLLTSVYSWPNLCDITFKSFLKIMSIALKKNSFTKESHSIQHLGKLKKYEKIGAISWRTVQILMLVIERYLEKLEIDEENVLNVLEIFSLLKGNFFKFCSFQALDQFNHLFIKLWKKANMFKNLDSGLVSKLTSYLILKLRMSFRDIGNEELIGLSKQEDEELCFEVVNQFLKGYQAGLILEDEIELKGIISWWIDHFEQEDGIKSQELVQTIASNSDLISDKNFRFLDKEAGADSLDCQKSRLFYRVITVILEEEEFTSMEIM